jgi:hypothetical protein
MIFLNPLFQTGDLVKGDTFKRKICPLYFFFGPNFKQINELSIYLYYKEIT